MVTLEVLQKGHLSGDMTGHWELTTQKRMEGRKEVLQTEREDSSTAWWADEAHVAGSQGSPMSLQR